MHMVWQVEAKLEKNDWEMEIFSPSITLWKIFGE